MYFVAGFKTSFLSASGTSQHSSVALRFLTQKLEHEPRCGCESCTIYIKTYFKATKLPHNFNLFEHFFVAGAVQ